MEDPGLPESLVLFFLLGALAVTAIWTGRESYEQKRHVIRLFLIAFVARFGLSVLVYQFGLVKVLGDEDGMGWFYGKIVYERWMSAGVSMLEIPGRLFEAFEGAGGQHLGYRVMLGAFFFVTQSPVRLAAAALNALYGGLIVVYVYRIARLLFSQWVATTSGWIICWAPSMIVWSALTVKEPIVILLETIALYGCLCIRRKEGTVYWLVMCALCTIALASLRFYATYIVTAGVLLSLTASREVTPARFASAVVLVLLVVAVLSRTGALAQHEEYVGSWDMRRIQGFRNALATDDKIQGGGKSGVRTSYDMTTPIGAAFAVGIGGVHLALAPFPWQLGGGSVRMLATLPELMGWWWLFFAGLVPGWRLVVRTRLADVSSMLVLILGFGLVYSATFGNVGLVFRQRAQLLPWLIVISCVGLQERQLRRLSVQQQFETSAGLPERPRRMIQGV